MSSALPDFNSAGDLPPQIHRASLIEIVKRFGTGTAKRKSLAATLTAIHSLAIATSKLDRMIIFGSFVTAKPEPGDVDIVLIMRDDFDMQSCEAAAHQLFNHQQAEKAFGASVFGFARGCLSMKLLKVLSPIGR